MSFTFPRRYALTGFKFHQVKSLLWDWHGEYLRASVLLQCTEHLLDTSLFQPLIQASMYCSSCANNNWHYVHIAAFSWIFTSYFISWHCVIHSLSLMLILMSSAHVISIVIIVFVVPQEWILFRITFVELCIILLLFLNSGIEGVGVEKRYILSLYWATATATGTGWV